LLTSEGVSLSVLTSLRSRRADKRRPAGPQRARRILAWALRGMFFILS
jgi:hypothetical protein